MATHGGKRPGSGRQKGVPNKINADLKSMILGALSAKGGQTYLEQQATANPTAFLTLVGKVLPMTIANDPENPVTFQIVSGVPSVEPVATPVNGKANGHANH